jgi:hypothetical protein
MLLKQTIVINKVITKVIASYGFLAKVSFSPHSHYLHNDKVNYIHVFFYPQVEHKATNKKSVIHLHQAQVLPTSSHANFIIIISLLYSTLLPMSLNLQTICIKLHETLKDIRQK